MAGNHFIMGAVDAALGINPVVGLVADAASDAMASSAEKARREWVRDMAASLELLRANGPEDKYRNDIAVKIVAMQNEIENKIHDPIELKDIGNYTRTFVEGIVNGLDKDALISTFKSNMNPYFRTNPWLVGLVSAVITAATIGFCVAAFGPVNPYVASVTGVVGWGTFFGIMYRPKIDAVDEVVNAARAVPRP